MEEGVRNKNSYWWVVVLIFVGIVVYFFNQPNAQVVSTPDRDTTFVVSPGHWYSCWNDSSNITITYEIASSSALDLIFTPTKEDAENLNETSIHYPSCHFPRVLNDKGSCIIPGNGCMVLLNGNLNDATVTLKYSAK